MKSRFAPRFVVVANPDCRRLALYSAALQKRGFGPPVVISYSDVLAGKIQLQQVIREGDVVRLESPGRNWQVEKALLKGGAKTTEVEGRYHFLPEDRAKNLSFEKGRLWPSRQWYWGLSALMHELKAQLKACPPHRLTHDSSDVLTFFDKPRCHALLQSHKIAVPAALPSPRNFEAFMATIRATGWRRVFLKLAHGSSAAGVVAFQTNGAQVQAITTTEVVRERGETRLYNSRRLRTYQTWAEVEELIDALCQEHLHVEKWFPKASLNGKTCDARIVVIGGRVWGGVTRLSQSPLTNLHLLNDRASLATLQKAMRESDWQAACQSCEAAMGLFPATLTGGVDLVFSPDFRRHAILEINAWGDLLPGAEVEGRDSYEAQIELFTSVAASQ